MTLAVARLVIRDEQANVQPSSRVVSEAERQYLLTRRQALIIELGGIEDYLGMERSIIPKHRRQEAVTRSRE